MQTCTKCGLCKSDDSFYRDSRMKRGFTSKCKSCHQLYLREKYAKDPRSDNERNRKWRQDNGEKVISQQKRYRENNPEVQRESSKRWEAKTGSAIIRASIRRCLVRNSIPSWCQKVMILEREWRAIHVGMQLDHIVPITPPLAQSVGSLPMTWHQRRKFIGPLVPLVQGFHYPANWQPMTKSNNSSKSNRDWPDAPWH